MGVSIKVNIVSAAGVGGVYPFVVVCFDGDISNELYKTDATTGGKHATWNHEHQLDLTSNIKSLVADGKPEPTYLTFFVFDTGAPGVPSLGSAGVLLETVRENGKAQGDFPIVNGTGSLRVIVTGEKTRTGHGPSNWSRKQKIAGGVGVAAVGAGLTALAVNHHKKKKKKEAAAKGEGNAEEDSSGEEETGKKRTWWKGGGKADNDNEEDKDQDQHQDQADDQGDQYPQATRSTPAVTAKPKDDAEGEVYDDGDYGEGAPEEEDDEDKE